jgi:hypothetical protein
VNECCKAVTKDAIKAERRRIREELAKLPGDVQARVVEAIFGTSSPPTPPQKQKWVDLSVAENP